MKFDIKKRGQDKIVFTADTNSFKDCVVLAVKRKVDLSYTDLRFADLQGADLQGADFYHVNFQGANLRGCNLDRADMTNVYLEGADLRDTSLIGTILRHALIFDCTQLTIHV